MLTIGTALAFLFSSDGGGRSQALMGVRSVGQESKVK